MRAGKAKLTKLNFNHCGSVQILDLLAGYMFLLLSLVVHVVALGICRVEAD